MESKVVATTEVHVGSKVTEMDTPEGPFYDVVRETAKSYWINLSDGSGETLRFAKSPRMGVRVAV